VVTQFLGHLMRGEPLRLVDGGSQRRCITDIRDGVEALMRILRNEGGGAEGRIFNVGNPRNDCSIAELADLLIDILAGYEPWKDLRKTAVVEKVSSEEYYGSGYQDIWTRVPDIRNAREHLDWEPRYDLHEALAHTVQYYIDRATP
jgi:nucleoside-diphosphate-sugar epimerase